MNSENKRIPDAVRHGLPLCGGLALAALLAVEVRALNWAEVSMAIGAIEGWRWVAALAATLVSFAAIGQYDVIAHRHFRTEMPERAARRAGMASIAVGQTTGFGPFVGAALRWRLMPDIGRTTLIRVTGFVTVTFFAVWGLLTLTLATPVLLGLPALALLTFPLGAAGLATVLFLFPQLTLFGRRMDLPSLPALTRLTGLAATDLVFAGLALWLLLPPEAAPALPLLIAAFALSLGLGMIGGTPGGVGPFELALVTVLPAAALPDLAAALIAFRLVYYAVPCLVGASYALLAKPCRRRPVVIYPAPSCGPRAELAIAAQSDSRALNAGPARAAAIRTPQSLTLFLGAARGTLSPLLPELVAAARAENRTPVLYKLSARDATHLRRLGWSVAAFAVDAMVDPRRFSLQGPDSRQLRRHLRKAEQGEVSVGRILAPDWEEMTAIHGAWEKLNGSERGVTMGRFCPLYLRDKPMFGAWHRGRLIAFISCVAGPRGWSLDLMRHAAAVPQGTMHALVHTMIVEAGHHQMQEVSLAALPHPGLPDWLRNRANSGGLARFKQAFAPRWQPLYMAAPTLPQLVLGAADIRRAILQPAPLTRTTEEIWELDALFERTPDPVPVPLQRAG